MFSHHALSTAWPRKTPNTPMGTPKTCYAYGEENRAEAGPAAPRTAHAATISGPASTTGSTSSPGRPTGHSRSPRPRAGQPTVTARAAHSPPPYTRPGSDHSPTQPRHRSTPNSRGPLPRTAPGRPPAPPTQIIPLYTHRHRPPRPHRTTGPVVTPANRATTEQIPDTTPGLAEIKNIFDFPY